MTLSHFEGAEDEIAERPRSHLEAAMDRNAEASERFDVGRAQAGQAVAIAGVAEAARLRSVNPRPRRELVRHPGDSLFGLD